MSSTTAPAEAFAPGEYLRDELVERRWSESEFAQIIGRPLQAVSEIINGKKEITAETAVAIADALGTSAELWLNLQAAHRLHAIRTTRVDDTPVSRRARLRSLVPVRELQKRGWLPETDDLDLLERSVCELLAIENPLEQPRVLAAARRANSSVEFTPEQMAWVARVQQLGTGRVSHQFDVGRLTELASVLVSRIHDPYDLENLRGWLADCGVTLVVELPLKSSKIDGVVLFPATSSPIVGLSTRGDRMDSFVFTLLHEIAHLVLGHVGPGSVQLDEDVAGGSGSNVEIEATEQAAQWVFPNGLDVGSGHITMAIILATARAYGVHASFVIGRLQAEERINWGQFRRSIPKVRPFVDLG